LANVTEGQQLAIDQLRAIQENAVGVFEVVGIAEPPNAAGWLCVDVSLDCSGKAYADGGIRLKAREWFTLGVPADFPYQLPQTWTRHTRFAGLPHVQWKKHLCLYQAPSTEWNVNDGMFGYLARLNVWLDHAAAGQLNPSGEALHPPVAYVPSGPVRVVIPRVDAPAIDGSIWIGFAQLNGVSETRADIVAWVPIQDIGEECPVAPAFLISEPMPFEFPQKMEDLFSELESRGVSVRLLISALRLAVLRNRETDPLFVILGTPMRGVAGTAEIKYHLAAWYVDPAFLGGLRLSLSRFDPNPQIQEIGEQVERIVVEWLKLTDVGWCLVREDRPEIVVARDRDASIAWFKGKAVSIWGCGALGSHVAEFLARAGVRRLVLRDNGVVTPGILVRQLFVDDDIGTLKVTALSARLKAIRPGIEIEEDSDDLLAGPLASGDWTDGADAVIETTGAGAVMVKMESARGRQSRRSPFVSMLIGHTAERAMILISGADHTGGPFDIDRKLRQECYRRPELHGYSEEFWPRQSRTEIFQPEPGCSDATFMGSCADVALLASTMLNLAAEELNAPSAPAVAHLLAQPVALGSKWITHKRFSWPADQVLEDPSSGYEVRLNFAAWRELLGWIVANERVRGINVETGGLLFGERNDLLKVLWVDEVSGPPPDSSHSAAGFVCGVQGTAELAREKANRTADLVRFQGMWHTHPGSLPIPSATDLRGIEQLVQATHSPRGKSSMLIVGVEDEGIYPSAAYIFSIEDFERIRTGGLTRSCSIRVSQSARSARSIGLALSGGGSRAIAFHLGCLRALHDRGVLDRISVISAVSGGAVIAAAYAYGQGSFADFDRSITALLRRGLQGDIVRKIANPAVAARLSATMAVAGSTAAAADIARFALRSLSRTLGLRDQTSLRLIKKLQPPVCRWESATVAFEAVLRDRIFGSLAISAPRRGNLEVVLNACELRSGSAFRFGSRESGCWRYGVVDCNKVDVAHAVAGSAAYPALLPALDEVITFIGRNGAKRKRRVLLTDGGVYDNLGVTCLESGSAGEIGYNRFEPEFIICCDAGQGIFDDYPVPYLWGPRMVRAFEAVFRKAQNATQSRLHLLAATDRLKGFVLAYLGQIDDRVPYAPPDFVRREEVIEYPTDFGAMRPKDIDRLSRRGEQLARSLVAYYCPEI
jgi:predicted acylesterase/phospholipase RssA/proteasome lid subunit RPN8/RPN11